MYRVIRSFADITDRSEEYPNGYVYRTGDEYPRKGRSVDEDRVHSLITGNNLSGSVFITSDIKNKPARKKKSAGDLDGDAK